MKIFKYIAIVCLVVQFVKIEKVSAIQIDTDSVARALSAHNIAQQRAEYHALLLRNGRARTATMVTSGVLVAAACCYVVREYYKPVDQTHAKVTRDGVAFDDAYAHIKFKEFLRSDEDLSFLQLLQKYFKQGFACAVGSVSAVFFMQLFNNAQETFSITTLRQLLYKTNFEGFQDVIGAAHRQATLFDDLCITMREQMALMPLVEAQDCAEFIDMYGAAIVDSSNLLVDAFEHLIAYVAACVDVLAPAESEAKNEFVAHCMRSLTLDIHVITHDVALALQTHDGQLFARHAVAIERRIKKIAMRLKTVMMLLSERVYGQTIKQ